MEGVVECLGDLKEIIASGDDLPASTSSSAKRGTRRFSISATPPPRAVEFTIFTVLPCKVDARCRNSSEALRPLTGQAESLVDILLLRSRRL